MNAHYQKCLGYVLKLNKMLCFVGIQNIKNIQSLDYLESDSGPVSTFRYDLNLQ